jgi:hypothetical protein
VFCDDDAAASADDDDDVLCGYAYDKRKIKYKKKLQEDFFLMNTHM